MATALTTSAAARPTVTRGSAVGMGAVLVAQLMLVLDATIVNVALPHIATDLHFSPASLSWVLSAYALAFGGLLLLGGRLGDVLGRRRTFLAGVAIFTAASLTGALAPWGWLLVAARALQGVGAALSAPAVLALLTTNAPDEYARTRALALFSAVSSGGGALGLILGGTITETLSWRWTLTINVPIGLVVLALVARLVQETPRRTDRFDVLGAVTATGGAVALVWTLTRADSVGWTGPQTLGGFAVALALFALLAVAERRHPHPLLRPSLLADRRRIAALVVMANVYAGMLAVFFVLASWFALQLGYSPLRAGLAFLPLPVGVFTMSRITPRLVRAVGRIPLILTGVGLLTTSYALLLRLDAGSTWLTGILPSVAMLGVGAGLTFMPITATVLDGVPHEYAGSASGLLQTMQQLGGAIGLAVVASVLAAFHVDGDFTAGGHAGIVAGFVLSLLAFVSALTLARRR
ncbi:MFS transporter [Nocardioides jiangxiensis]|uniref:MFS transporter n=1 Tax=Nocardioides jiangxiensis TaxID=3064524 RepID=A0ABT9B3M8_9ACTN|nr:MFS transporter [Nocardioides sp. WY-20]MDO7867901.1 MFS transporter [Nocardioides sp. WY-20]